MTDVARPRRLFDGMRFFVTHCAMKTLKRIDDNQPHQPAHSDLILNMLVNVGGMVQQIQLCCEQTRNALQIIVNRVNPKRSLSHARNFAVRPQVKCAACDPDDTTGTRGRILSLA